MLSESAYLFKLCLFQNHIAESTTHLGSINMSGLETESIFLSSE